MGSFEDIASCLALKALQKEMREIYQDLEAVAMVDGVAGVPGANKEFKRRRIVISPLLKYLHLRPQVMTPNLQVRLCRGG